ncbi:MAG: TraR/DksA family transcriptional regulator [Saprospiraceae bacterium]|nr:TraR/DksA family transcriptional regulator [Saprospiraceae bacterium]
MKTRYSDVELEEFRVLVEDKLVKARKQLDDLQGQIVEVTESSEDGFGTDWIEDSSVGSQIDFLNEMVSRQRKYIDQLENALLRIGNKTYGICAVSGELIDKRRLLAVPTTTKSVNAKTAAPEKSRAQLDQQLHLANQLSLLKW